MRILLAAAMWWLFLCGGGFATAQDWVYGHDRLSRLDVSTLAPTLSVPVHRIDAMSSDGAGGLWYATPHALVRRDAAGMRQVRRPLWQLGLLREVAWMAADPYAGQTWVSDGTRLVGVDGVGSVRVSRLLASAPIALALAQDQHLWMLEKKRLLRLRRDGSVASALDLRASLQGAPTHLALDDFGGRVWILAERRGIAVGGSGAVLGRLSLGAPARDACVIPGSNQLWVLTANAVELRDRDGALRNRTALRSLGTSSARSVVCHWMRQELWLVHDSGITRIGAAGTVLGTIASKATARVETAALQVFPELRLVQPPRDALTGDPRPLFELALAFTCGSAACPPLPDYLEGARIESSLDGQEVGARFALDVAAASAAYRPEVALEQGAHRIVARLIDRFAHRSAAIDSTFTVDSVAPVIVTMTPGDGTVSTAAQAIVSGSVDDLAARVVLENQAALGAVQLPAAPGTFAFAIPLQPGSNLFTFSAIDPAGNVGSRTLRLVRAAEQIGATVSEPADGATVQADSVVVRGTVDAGGQRVGVSINGEPAFVVGNAFHAQVPLQPGVNTLEVRVVGADGRQITRTLGVTRQGTRAFRVSAWPAIGIAPSNVRFAVGPLGTRTVKRIQIDFQGDGIMDLSTTDPAAEPRFTYATPGVYRARVLVTDTVDDTEVHFVQVVVQELAVLDQELKALLGGMLASLRAGDIDSALRMFAPGVQARYRSLFELARPNLMSAVDRLGTIQDGSIVGTMAEYVMVQDRPSGPKAYFVYLTKGRDGLWRIQQM